MVTKPHTPGPRVDLPGQLEMPQTEARPADLAKAQAAAPMRPSKPQRPCDHGLFSDEAAQLDLLDIESKGTADNPIPYSDEAFLRSFKRRVIR